ncbi:hypothetical protein PVAG01_00381 [Phlyctema vagabunda]|uniref:Uncharacterized protein n=1 Tax=Phlyctema vagabunda TaxID=108571 RepID=A0ABR4PU22_9HELO
MEAFRNIFARKTTSPNASARNSRSGLGSASGVVSGKARHQGSKLKASPYDSAVALDPPIRGLYPVAGNGPNVLEELQRSKEYYDTEASTRQSASTAEYPDTPNIPQWRQDGPQRPKTAPQKEEIFFGRQDVKGRGGRAMSGSSTSTSTFRQVPHGPQHWSTGAVIHDSTKRVVSSQPARLSDDDYIDLPPPNLHATHSRAESPHSRASYIDVLVAHKTLLGTSEAVHDVIKASGRRSHGEDVADRNIVDHVEADMHDEPDEHFSQFSYHGKVSFAATHGGSTVRHTRLDSTFENVLVYDDDTQPQHTPLTSRPASQSQSQTVASISGSRPGNAFPVRVDSISTYQAPGRRIDDRTRSMRRRTLSSSSSAVIHEEPSSRTSRRQSLTQAVSSDYFGSTHEEDDTLLQDQILPHFSSPQFHIRRDSAASSAYNFSRRTPIFSDSVASSTTSQLRGRSQASSTDTFSYTRSGSTSAHHGIPKSKRFSVYLPEAVDKFDFSPTIETPPVLTPSRTKRRSFDPSDQHHSHRRRSPPCFSLKQPRRYSVESSDDHDISSTHSGIQISMSHNNKGNYLVEGAKEAPSLDGIVDLKDSVDTEVITTQAPAVTHEYITNKIHHVREEVISREIHTHDVFHRILPVIETEILPTKHYVQATDGSLREIPADQVPGRTNVPSFEIIPTDKARKTREAIPGGSIVHIGHHNQDSGPVLSSRKDSLNKDGIPKTESVWRHPPTLDMGSKETGQSVPMYFNEGHESDGTEPDYTTEKVAAAEGDDMLFRDSGYGAGGMLPGLAETASTAIHGRSPPPRRDHPRNDYSDSSGDGEASKALRRRREAKEKLRRAYEEDGVSGVTRGMQSLDVDEP